APARPQFGQETVAEFYRTAQVEAQLLEVNRDSFAMRVTRFLVIVLILVIVAIIMFHMKVAGARTLGDAVERIVIAHRNAQARALADPGQPAAERQGLGIRARHRAAAVRRLAQLLGLYRFAIRLVLGGVGEEH